jgi:serine protease Do
LIQLVEKPDHTLPEAKFGDSSQMAAGDWVMAIGNPFSNGWSVTVGVVSATERPFAISDNRSTEMIQTDAAINPGNSGGPLLNLRGEVIGMNTAILSSGRVEGNIGIGFAVPSNTIRDLLPQLSTGKVVRGRIGVQIGPIPREGFEDFGLKTRTGALVQTVIPNGAAEKAGLAAGDIILDFNGKPIANANELTKTVIATKPGITVPMRVLRNKREQTLRVTVEELDFEAERQGAQQSSAPRRELPEVQGQDSFGLTLSNLTPADARRLDLPSGRTGAVVRDIDPNGPSAGRLQEGDVILTINDQRIAGAAEAGRVLQQIPSGRNARILLWREGREAFVTVRKD